MKGEDAMNRAAEAECVYCGAGAEYGPLVVVTLLDEMKPEKTLYREPLCALCFRQEEQRGAF